MFTTGSWRVLVTVAIALALATMPAAAEETPEQVESAGESPGGAVDPAPPTPATVPEPEPELEPEPEPTVQVEPDPAARVVPTSADAGAPAPATPPSDAPMVVAAADAPPRPIPADLDVIVSPGTVTRGGGFTIEFSGCPYVADDDGQTLQLAGLESVRDPDGGTVLRGGVLGDVGQGSTGRLAGDPWTESSVVAGDAPLGGYTFVGTCQWRESVDHSYVAVSADPATLIVASDGSEPFVVAPTSVDFGDVMVGQVAELDVTVTNPDGVERSLTMAGGAPVSSGLTVTDACASLTALGPGASCDVTYRFAPTAAGPVAESVIVTVNGVQTTLQISGNGLDTSDPALTIDPVSVARGDAFAFTFSGCPRAEDAAGNVTQFPTLHSVVDPDGVPVFVGRAEVLGGVHQLLTDEPGDPHPWNGGGVVAADAPLGTYTFVPACRHPGVGVDPDWAFQLGPVVTMTVIDEVAVAPTVVLSPDAGAAGDAFTTAFTGCLTPGPGGDLVAQDPALQTGPSPHSQAFTVDSVEDDQIGWTVADTAVPGEYGFVFTCWDTEGSPVTLDPVTFTVLVGPDPTASIVPPSGSSGDEFATRVLDCPAIGPLGSSVVQLPEDQQGPIDHASAFVLVGSDLEAEPRELVWKVTDAAVPGDYTFVFRCWNAAGEAVPMNPVTFTVLGDDVPVDPSEPVVDVSTTPSSTGSRPESILPAAGGPQTTLVWMWAALIGLGLWMRRIAGRGRST